ncbi:MULTISPECIES: hypothetical protein [unclassified Burkholderia]|uniref:hypothetical protein n=1 Tax=unclassified Burkholderia TaxID=2613784 RepID=UPI001E5A57BC|nr:MULTISPECIES: hypothetical protein [unclassified Burkholderia]UEP29916.1 hypothetical protein LMA01_26235 [Burkholderia sp. B21-007]UEP44772.1 hypothetical protein LMA02_18545 [Burkholderia sp. B21-005]
MNQVLLDKISEELWGGGLNYCVFLKAYTVAAANLHQSAELISTALGEGAIVVDVVEVGVESVVDTVKFSLLYAGDNSAGPSKEALESEVLAGMLGELLLELRLLMAKATSVEAFALKAGHPFYPVFWDFSFIFRSASNATIFIGASSD